jgi:hypothetical protein
MNRFMTVSPAIECNCLAKVQLDDSMNDVRGLRSGRLAENHQAAGNGSVQVFE